MKTLTTSNWLEPDPAATIFSKTSHANGSVSPMSGEDWVSQFLSPTLTEDVPETVRILFEVARGSLSYGYFFYPLYTLAGEQIFRVAESAISEKCKLLGASKKVHRFEQKIEFLFENGFFSKHQVSEWHSLRKFRNLTSHPKQQMILPPGAVANLLDTVASKINGLFQ